MPLFIKAYITRDDKIRVVRLIRALKVAEREIDIKLSFEAQAKKQELEINLENNHKLKNIQPFLLY